jgi:cobalt-zinc-cadmium efflux system protein
VLGDLLGSVAALLSGAVILATDWRPVDPLLSLLICALILVSAFRILREGWRILLEGVPHHLDGQAVGRAMVGVEGVRGVHDLHVWQVSSKSVALSAHVVVVDPAAWEETLDLVRQRLRDEFGIDHVTLQPERPPARVQIEPTR